MMPSSKAVTAWWASVKNLWAAAGRLWPYFMLHLGRGLSGSFTSLLVAHLASLDSLGPQEKLHYTWLIASLEDVPPVLLALLGGFLQQLVGPRRMLLAAALPGFLSWMVVVMGPNSIPCLMTSRLLAGLSKAFLTGNVYMADCAPSQLVPSLKQIEAACRSLGSVLIFVFFIAFHSFGFWMVALVCGLFPLLGLLGTCVFPESPVFLKRVSAANKLLEASPSSSSAWSRRLTDAKKRLHVPIGRAEVYRPLILIMFITSIQHFSGLTFTRKFLLQVLAPISRSNSTETMETANSTAASVVANKDQTAYYFAIFINTLQFTANLLMSDLLKHFRIRFLYFFSLFTTACCLGFLGFLFHPSASHAFFSSESDQYLRVVTLSIHVFSVQFGVQTLAGLLTDTFLPSHSRPMLKGIIRSTQSLSLFAFVSLITLLPEAWRYWTMAVTLLAASPVLYVCLPELRKLGRSAWQLYFSSESTIFYVAIPFSHNSRVNNRWKTVANVWRAMKAFKSSVPEVKSEEKADNVNREEPQPGTTHSTVIEVTAPTIKASFRTITLKELTGQEDVKLENQLSVTFVQNILSRNSYLAEHPDPDRLIIARGPAKNTSGSEVGIFLFLDIVIVARKLMRNRKYIDPVVIKLDDSFSVTRNQTSLAFKDSCNSTKVVFKSGAKAVMWEQYASFCWNNKKYQKTDQSVA